MTIDEAREHIGEVVAYRPFADSIEQGVITGTSGQFVFVRYGSDVSGKATLPELLTLVGGQR